ncbi:PREDICTED: T-cell activation Rho GTPase-activating protein [Nanorana parkeri]|uniref:T-cell activation Rho GTPase-activating protein n=1 Tax=Nanorana parkeri TaxID=125878 RepID=UPI000854BDBD|nr:PREDICTED: T-cell activation Rho GTPase-activating protein [Nanorana parkeri]
MSSSHPRNKARRGSYDGILHNKNTLHKSLAQRRCSAPSLVFPKSLSKPWSTGRENTGCFISIEQCPFVLGLSSEDSELILHECVQLTQDLKTKERYLFLFSDMIIIAKLKSGTSFRLKHRVHLSEMMVLSCDDEDDEEHACAFHSSPKDALIFIWPCNGCVASFRSSEVKELWLDTLVWQIREVGGIEGTTVPFTRLLMKVLTGCNASKALVANNMESLIECHTEADAKKYQLLADMIHKESICHVIESNKKRKAVISWPFTLRRSSPISEPSSPLFNQPLSIVCEEDNLPKAIFDILTILRMQGPLIEGVFRKAANEKSRKELKEDLNYGRGLDLESKPVHLLAVVFKDFLRGIPHQLLSSELYNEWMLALDQPTLEEKIKRMQCVADKLPKPNHILLQHLMCVLHHISSASNVNKMDSRNLAVCIAPNMLVPQVDKDLPLETQKEINEKVTVLVEFFIDNCLQLFGDHILQLHCVSEEDSLENIDTTELSSHQNDSAYDSTDPDHDCHASTLTRHLNEQRGQNRALREKSAEDRVLNLLDSTLDQIKCEASMDRRCSEPYIFPSQDDITIAGKKLTRSHDDVTVRKQTFSDVELSTHTPEKYCGRALYRKNMPKDLRIFTSYTSDTADHLSSTASSNCSIDSSYSDCSVFTSSPMVSPLSPHKNDLVRHKSFCMKNKDLSDTIKAGTELKKHSNSFCYVNNKKVITKTQSWGPDVNRGDIPQNELIRSGHKKSERELEGTRDTAFQQPQVVRLRPQSARRISVDEVFRMVDQRNPGKPPSYEEAINKNASSYKSMTPRASVSNSTCSTTQLVNDSSAQSCSAHHEPSSLTDDQMPNPCGLTQPNCQSKKTKSDLVRTKSESCHRNRHECLSRRCSQPIFEIYDQIQYAKESYV